MNTTPIPLPTELLDRTTVPASLYVTFNMEVAMLRHYRQRMIEVSSLPPSEWKSNFNYALNSATYEAYYSLYEKLSRDHALTDQTRRMLLYQAERRAASLTSNLPRNRARDDHYYISAQSQL